MQRGPDRTPRRAVGLLLSRTGTADVVDAPCCLRAQDWPGSHHERRRRSSKNRTGIAVLSCLNRPTIGATISWENAMPRYAFKLRIKPDAIEEYEREHRRVWPELLAKLKEVGISDYSIFRRGQELVLVLRVDDFEKAWDELDRDPVNQRWQVFMSRLFEPVPGIEEGERFAMMKEVFYLE